MHNVEPLIVAHRGASGDAPENTIPAFLLGWQQGADAIEGDFHLTADGEIVCIHNPTTATVAGVDLVVARSTLKELKQLDVGAWFGKTWAGTTIPTLAEVVDTIPKGKRIFLEIKSGPEIIPKVFKTLQRFALTPSQIVIISFDPAVISTVKDHAPEIKALLLCGFQENQQSGIITPTIDDILAHLQRAGADGLSSEAHASIDEVFVRTVVDAGYEYHVWTVNDVKTATRFRRLGARSITTNVPGYLRKHIVNTPL